ncbi:MAG: hypothetical protein E7425_04565 [Ruminococcaceae bacterium]|nr:hypothetical protein [Oscillospiraceae bacterium]
MTHYVLLKLAAGADLDAAEKTAADAYKALAGELSFFHDPAVYRCCTERDSNAHLMAVCRLDGPEHLDAYLTHPLHLSMAKTLGPIVVGRTTFDHE